MTKAKYLSNAVKFHSSLDNLIKYSKADIFLISTPNHTHYEIGSKLISNNRAVLFEKPVSTNRSELLDLQKQIANSREFVSVALHAAYAQDVNWWIENQNITHKVGDLTGFNAGFFDPYIEHGKVISSGQGLGGSWIDSGINALSVIGRFFAPERLTISESRMTMLANDGFQAQGSALLQFNHNDGIGHGFIDTNWTLGINRKTTRLWYQGADILLHHSLESVFKIEDKKMILLKNLQGDKARLTNHYISLFSELKKDYRNGNARLEHAVALHEILFHAMDKTDNFQGFD